MELRGMHCDEACREYMEVVSQYPEFGACLFQVAQQQQRSWPVNVILSISRVGIALLDPVNHVPLVRHAFTEITSFGAPIPCSYHFVLERGPPLAVETPQVLTISKMMKAYISRQMKL
eukprot:m.2388 g.2388  ORF g.2388 m.2388 type:complete len:118 (-) comp1787_c0_seq1:26-379(-)